MAHRTRWLWARHRAPALADRSGGDTSDAFEDRLDRLEDAPEARADQLDLVGGPFDLPELHLLLGRSILVIAVVRPLWRRYDGFPPWSEVSRRESVGSCTSRSGR